MITEQSRILFGITTKSHIEIALDEMYGLQELGYTCDQFEFGGKKNFKSAVGRFYIILLNATKLLIKAYKFKPDFIYLNSRVEYIASARDYVTIMILRIFYNKKVHFLLKSHGSNLEVLQTQKYFFKKIVFPFLKRSVRAWLFLSSEELSWIVLNNLLEEKKLFLAKNIVRPYKFKPDNSFRKDMKIAPDAHILLFVGRIVKEKGLIYVVDALAEIKQKHKVFMIIVGDGKELASIRKRIVQLGISEDVMITGWIDEAKVARFTSNSDVLIYPTFAPEGFPMALFNSMAAGLSILTTRTRASNDYMEEPENCLWVEPRSATSISKSLDKLLNEPELMSQMRVNNKQKSYLFTKEVVAKELSAILHSISVNEYDQSFRQVQKLIV